MIIGMALEVVGIALLVPLINLLTSDQTFPQNSILDPVFKLFNASAKTNMLIVGFLVISAMILFKNLYSLVVTNYQQRFVSRVWRNLQSNLFDGYISSSYRFHLNTNSSNLLRNLTTEIEQVTEKVLLPMVSMFIEIFIVVGIASLLFYREPIVSLALVAFFAFCGFVYTKFVSPTLIKYGEQKIRLRSEFLKSISETLGGIKQIKVLGREKYFHDKFATTSHEIAAVNTISGTLQSIPPLLVELWGVLGLTIVITVMLLRNLDQELILSTLALFVGASYRFVPGLNRILSAISSLKHAAPSIDIVYSEVIRKTVPIEHQKEVLHFNESLEFKNVSFSYDIENSNIVSNISLTIYAGETIGIIGQSGAGKSTLVDLLLGLLKPTTGQIQVDGKIVDLEKSTWRSNAGYVPQQIYLIDDSIQANIAFGVHEGDISREQLMQSIALTGLDKLIDSLPLGISTSTGERGMRISGGQRQRIGIARALYHQPSILILDEATSALDIESEEELIREIDNLHRKLTIVIISHRMSTLAGCDRIFRLDNGHLIESR